VAVAVLVVAAAAVAVVAAAAVAVVAVAVEEDNLLFHKYSKGKKINNEYNQSYSTIILC
jgi:hypothetical protein